MENNQKDAVRVILLCTVCERYKMADQKIRICDDCQEAQATPPNPNWQWIYGAGKKP